MTDVSLTSIIRPLWRLLERYKIDPEFVFREAGLDPTLMNAPQSRYSAEGVEAAFAKAAASIEDPCFGLRVAEVWSVTDMHALGYAFLASRTLRMGLHRLTRYIYIVDHAVTFKLEDKGEWLCLQLITENAFGVPSSAPEEDYIWAIVMSLCRATFGEQLNPIEVRLLHQELRCQEAYAGFYRCPVYADTRESTIMFARADVDRQLPAPNRDLATANDRILSDFLANLQQNDLSSRVKTAISNELPSGTPSEEIIAKAVFMSTRTLRRKLAADGTSCSQLIDAVRRGLAEQYLSETARPLSEIAFLLGFSELSAFSRAFKRWTGQAPSAFRNALSA